MSTQATSDESAPAETSADKPASDEPAPELASVTTMEPHTHATAPPKEQTGSVVINDLGAALSARHRARAGATTSGEWRARGSPQQQRMIHHLCSLEFVKYYTSEAWTISESSLGAQHQRSLPVASLHRPVSSACRHHHHHGHVWLASTNK